MGEIFGRIQLGEPGALSNSPLRNIVGFSPETLPSQSLLFYFRSDFPLLISSILSSLLISISYIEYEHESCM